MAEVDLLRLRIEALKGVRPQNIKFREPLEKGPGGVPKPLCFGNKVSLGN